MTAIPPNMDSAIRERTGEIGDFVGVGVGVAAVVAGGRVVSVGPEVFIVVMVFVGDRTAARPTAALISCVAMLRG